MGEGANRAKKTKTEPGPIQVILLTKRYKDSEIKARQRTRRSRLEKSCSIPFHIINDMGVTLHSRRIPHKFGKRLFRNALQRQICGIAMSENMRSNSRRRTMCLKPKSFPIFCSNFGHTLRRKPFPFPLKNRNRFSPGPCAFEDCQCIAVELPLFSFSRLLIL